MRPRLVMTHETLGEQGYAGLGEQKTSAPPIESDTGERRLAGVRNQKQSGV